MNIIDNLKTLKILNYILVKNKKGIKNNNKKITLINL